MTYQSVTDEIFVKEMRILWQNVDDETRDRLGDIIRSYFDEGNRSELIINKMQEKIER